jgi:acetylornithine/N-succinyldiaminopimelate aminotransferase
VDFNDLAAVEEAISEKTCAVMLEPIQAEGGIYPADAKYMTALRQMTREKDILMILDEVQTGMGRTGKFFGYEHYGIEPDIMSLAKALGNGFPVGAIVAKDEVMQAFEPGTHASTFGGNPLAAAAVVATINTLIDEGVIKNCEEAGRYLYDGLQSLRKKYSFIKDIRGMGLILGVELDIDGDAIQREFMKEGIILNCTKGKILRLVPPLIVKTEEIDLFLETAEGVFSRQTQSKKG